MKTNPIFIVAVFLAVGCGNRDNGVVFAQTKTPVSEKESVESEEGMVLIKGGAFTSVIGQETKKVTIKPFLMDKYEVTIAEFEKFVKATGYVPESDKPGAKTLILKSKQENVIGVNWRFDERGNERDISAYNCPVIHVSYEDAEAYAKWAGKRLPTIYEWQYSAIGGADELAVMNHINNNTWHFDNTRNIHPVGMKDPNHFGLYDIFGNVGEYVSHEGDKSPLPPGSTQENRVRSAHSSFFEDAEALYPPVFAHGHRRGTGWTTGFRCAKDITN